MKVIKDINHYGDLSLNRKTGIVICSRLNSSRIYQKAIVKINGKPLIQHLIDRLDVLNLPIILAVPEAEFATYQSALAESNSKNLVIFPSRFSEDPLARSYQVAREFSLNNIIRVTHDKIFVDVDNVFDSLRTFENEMADYLYSSNAIDGTRYEIVSFRCLEESAGKYKNIEHLSYAFRICSGKTINYNSKRPSLPVSLLIDFPEDLNLIEVVLSRLGNSATISQILEYLEKNSELLNINYTPVVSIYTCAYNAEKYLKKCIDSVLKQSSFDSWGEYILVDDFSSDKTLEIMAKHAIKNKNVKWYRNQKNMGLAYSSNVAISKSRGRFVIRLDADDVFIRSDAVLQLVHYIANNQLEVVYPDNYFGSVSKIQKGNECHHVGGAIFDRRALNYLKFTDDLRNYEGLDLFKRAKNQLKIGYFEKPIFLYRQHPESMSKKNQEERSQTLKMIESKYAEV